MAVFFTRRVPRKRLLRRWSPTTSKAAGALVNPVMPADLGTLTLAGQTTVLRASHVPLAAGLGTLTLSGQTVSLRITRKLVASLGTLTLAGQTAIVRYARKMPAGQGTLTPSGQNVTLRYSRKMPAGLGTITLAGPVVNTIYSGCRQQTAAGGLGVLTLAGQPVTLRYTRKMPAALRHHHAGGADRCAATRPQDHGRRRQHCPRGQGGRAELSCPGPAHCRDRCDRLDGLRCHFADNPTPADHCSGKPEVWPFGLR